MWPRPHRPLVRGMEWQQLSGTLWTFTSEVREARNLLSPGKHRTEQGSVCRDRRAGNHGSAHKCRPHTLLAYPRPPPISLQTPPALTSSACPLSPSLFLYKHPLHSSVLTRSYWQLRSNSEDEQVRRSGGTATLESCKQESWNFLPLCGHPVLVSPSPDVYETALPKSSGTGCYFTAEE